MKKLEKITRYEDLRIQLQKLWNVKVTFIIVVVGALGTVSEERENFLKTTGIPIVMICLRKGTFILRRVLDI